MHELFLIAHLSDDYVQRALRIFQGYCGMSPVTLFRRRMIFEGPRLKQLKGIDPTLIQNQKWDNRNLWKSLHGQITRQSYVVTLIFDINKDHFGQPEVSESQGLVNELGKDQPIQDCNQLPGTLRWTDLPDPGKRPVNSRLLISIENEKGLCSTMMRMQHRFMRELIQECHRFVHNNVVFELSRYLLLPPNEMETLPTIRSRLPAYDTLTPFDLENKWVLIASAVVFNGDDPEQMQKGIDELLEVKADFEGCFEFQTPTLDTRHIFDTRVKF